MTQQRTGYPSIDRPWEQYYSAEAMTAPLPECSIYDYLWQFNKSHLEDTALIYFGRKISFQKLFDSIESAAAAFWALGVRENDVVAICSVTLPEVIYSVYALNRLGATANIIDPRINISRLKDCIGGSHVTHIIALDKVIPKIEALKKDGFSGSIIGVSAKDSLPLAVKMGYSLKNRAVKGNALSWKRFLAMGRGIAVKDAEYRKKRAAVIVYTGGTTGTPKGAILTDDTLNIIAHQYRYLGANYNRSQNFLDIMPPFAAYGIVCGIHMPLSLGMNDVLIPLFNPDEFDDLMIRYKPAHFLGVPSHYDKLSKSLKMRNADLSYLESAGAGGDAVSIKTEKEINAFLKSHGSQYDIAKGYGMTEVGSAAVACHGTVNKLGSAGIPHCKTLVSVFEPGTDRELQYNQVGEICISTPAMMLGYLDDKDSTEAVLRKHADGKIWVHSNDLGYMDEDGFLFISGRIKRMIIRPDGHKVFPAIIENTVAEHYAVEACAVVGKADKSSSRGEFPVAFIVLKEAYRGKKQILKEIESMCAEKIPPRDTAVEFYEIETLPLTEIGKVDYEALIGYVNVGTSPIRAMSST